MSADKKIRVSEESREELHNLKEPGESYDEVIQELVEEHKKRQLFEMVEEKKERDDFVPLRDALDDIDE